MVSIVGSPDPPRITNTELRRNPIDISSNPGELIKLILSWHLVQKNAAAAAFVPPSQKPVEKVKTRHGPRRRKKKKKGDATSPPEPLHSL